MATQRMMVATLAGQAANVVKFLFEHWRSDPDPVGIDEFCAAMRANSLSLSVVYFTEWVDRWLMGDLVPGPGAVDGQRFKATCLTPAEAVKWADDCGSQFDEQIWMAARLREAAAGWRCVAEPYAIVVIRETVGPSADDAEILAAAERVPEWLCTTDKPDAQSIGSALSGRLSAATPDVVEGEEL